MALLIKELSYPAYQEEQTIYVDIKWTMIQIDGTNYPLFDTDEFE